MFRLPAHKVLRWTLFELARISIRISLLQILITAPQEQNPFHGMFYALQIILFFHQEVQMLQFIRVCLLRHLTW